MDNVVKIIILLLMFIYGLTGCKKRTQSNIETRNLYIETVGFTPELKACFSDYFFNKHTSDTTWFMPDAVIYYYKDASVLPDKNLLDNTKKMKITLLEKDSVGNPAFSVEVFRTENSEWKRVGNSGRNTMYVDSLLTMEEFCNILRKSTYTYILKFNP